MNSISTLSLEDLQERYRQYRANVIDRDYDDSDLAVFRSIVERLVDLVPVLEPFFVDVNDDTDGWLYLCGGFATHEMVEIYANKIMAVWDNMDFIQQHNKINHRLKKILNVSCYVNGPDQVDSSDDDEGDDDASTDYSDEDYQDEEDEEDSIPDDNDERTVESPCRKRKTY